MYHFLFYFLTFVNTATNLNFCLISSFLFVYLLSVSYSFILKLNLYHFVCFKTLYEKNVLYY